MEPDLRDQPTEWIESEVCTLAGHLAAATCRFLLLIAELDRREAWRTWEARSCAHWLSWRCALSLRAAREHVRVGRALADLPVATRELAAGRLSYSKVRAITRIATPETERDLVDLALHATAAQVERVASAQARIDALSDPDQVAGVHAARGVHVTTADDGTVTLHAHVAPDVAATVLGALDAIATQLPPAVDGPAGPSQRRADALQVLAEQALAPATSAPVRHEIEVHVDVETLAGSPGTARMEPAPGADILVGGETARRLACDAGLRVHLEQAGRTLDVGRRTRRVPAALRRAIETRDERRCRFPGCTHRRHLHAHHLRHWARGGPTAAENLVLLCSAHHRAVHEGRWRVEGSPSGSLVFVPPVGRRLPEVPEPLPRTTPGELARRHAASGPPIGPETVAGKWDGSALDLDLATTVLSHPRRAPAA